MTDEERNSAGNGDDPIADAEALLRGMDAQAEPEIPVETATEIVAPVALETHVEEIEHGEKSKEGRQVKRLRVELAEMKSLLREALAKTNASPQVASDDPEPELSEIPTAEEVRAHSQWTVRQIQQVTTAKADNETAKKKRYGEQYTQTLKDYVDVEEEPELFALLTDTRDLTYNSVLSNFEDPHKDFLTNLRNAQAHLEGKTKPRINVRGAETVVPKGTNTGASTTKVAGADVDVSGWSVEEQQVAKMFTPEELKQMRAEKRL